MIKIGFKIKSFILTQLVALIPFGIKLIVVYFAVFRKCVNVWLRWSFGHSVWVVGFDAVEIGSR